MGHWRRKQGCQAKKKRDELAPALARGIPGDGGRTHNVEIRRKKVVRKETEQGRAARPPDGWPTEKGTTTRTERASSLLSWHVGNRGPGAADGLGTAEQQRAKTTDETTINLAPRKPHYTGAANRDYL